MHMRVVLLVAMLMFVADAHAKEPVLAIGAGLSSCGKWIEVKDNPTLRNSFEQWVVGFISGANWASVGVMARPVDFEAITVFVDQYCAQKPLDTVAAAAIALVNETRGPTAASE
jgi:hypothetical protein